MNMQDFVAPRSDQLNSDDLIGGARTIIITKVVGTGSADQPVAVHYQNDGGRPWKPCKSMRRVLIAIWGADASQYIGRSLTIYSDPKVAFGGMEVGGIRVSHASHMEREMVMALTVTKAKRSPYTVRPLAAEPSKPAAPAADSKAFQVASMLVGRIHTAPDMAALEAITAEETVTKQRAWLAEKRPELARQVDGAVIDALAVFDAPAAEPADADDTWPGPKA